MKKALYSWSGGCFFVLLARPAAAQQVLLNDGRAAFRKGSQQVTLSYGYGKGYLVSNRYLIQLQAGYYVASQLVVGVAGSLNREWLGDLHTGNQYSVGPWARYQFGAGRFSPFLEAAYLIGQPTPATRQAATLTPGISVGLLPQFRLEASYRLTVLPESERIGLAQVGVTFLPGTKR